MIVSAHIIKCYGKNAKTVALINIFMLFWVSSGTLILKLTESVCVHIIIHKIWMSYYPKNELLRDEQ